MAIGIQTQLVNTSWSDMLGNMLSEFEAYSPGLLGDWNVLEQELETMIPTTDAIQTGWHGMLDYMQSQENAYYPYLSYGWDLLKQDLVSLVPTADAVKVGWHGMLDDMQHNLNAYRPYLEYGIDLLDGKLSSLEDTVKSLSDAWSNAMSSMRTSLENLVKPIKVPAPSPILNPSPAANPSPAPSGQPATDTGRPAWVDNNPVLGPFYKKMDWLANNTAWLQSLAPFLVPGGSGAGASGMATGLLSKASSALSDMLSGLGISVPAFASGAVVYGPTLAMVGDNHGASTDPEVIAPLSKLQGMVGGDSENREAVVLLREILKAVKDGNGKEIVISASDLGSATVRYINDTARRRGGISPLNI